MKYLIDLIKQEGQLSALKPGFDTFTVSASIYFCKQTNARNSP